MPNESWEVTWANVTTSTGTGNTTWVSHEPVVPVFIASEGGDEQVPIMRGEGWGVLADNNPPVFMPVEEALWMAVLYKASINFYARAPGSVWEFRYFPDEKDPFQTWKEYVQSSAVLLRNHGIEYVVLEVFRNQTRQRQYLSFRDLRTWQQGGRVAASQRTLEELFQLHGFRPVTYYAGNLSSSISIRCEYCGSQQSDLDTPYVYNPSSGEHLCGGCLKDNSTGWCNDCGARWIGHIFGDYFYCSAHAPTCHNCGEGMEDGEYSQHGSYFYCEPCYNEMFQDCARCNGMFYRDDMTQYPDPDDEDYDEDGPALYCSPCYDRVVAEGRRVPAQARSLCHTDAPPTPAALPFGVEIEAHFANTDIRLGGWHTRFEAEAPLFSHWRAETDSSIVGGGEIISPILEGAAGVAEVVATMAVLREFEASMTGACGQHIHIQTALPPVRVQGMAAMVEDLLIAATGSFRRWSNQAYAPRIKSEYSLHTATNVQHNLQHVPDDEPELLPTGAVAESRGIAHITDYGTYEFRHPPGTLDRRQFVINHGLVNFVVKYAEQASVGELKEAIRFVVANLQNPGGPHVHEFIREAAKFVREKGGWTEGGDWLGLPYKPKRDETTLVTVVDDRRGLSREVKLPSEKGILNRLHRQLTTFYVSAHRIGGWWPEKEGRDRATEVMEVFV